MLSLLIVVHAASTWFMTGLIWFVQVVHYPLFALVGEKSFTRYEKAHARQTTWVVLPVMTLELASSVWLWQKLGSFPTLLGLILVVLIWLSTFLIQTPIHARLSSGFQSRLWESLVKGNWVRTALWSTRGILAAFLLLQMLSKT